MKLIGEVGMTYLIQVRKFGSAWDTRYKVEDLNSALHYYASLNTFGPYRKRFIQVNVEGKSKTIFNQITELPWSVRD